MNQSISNYHNLHQSIQKNTKDYQLLSTLQKSILKLNLSQCDQQVYIKLMFSIYDLSNHHSFIHLHKKGGREEGDGGISKMGLMIRLLACQMICKIIDEFGKINFNSHINLDTQIEIQAFEIMVLTVSLCLETAMEAEVGHIWGYVKLLAGRCGNIDNKISMLYLLCNLHILKLTLNHPTFSLTQLHQTLTLSQKLSQKLQHPLKHKFLTRIAQTAKQFTLKLLREGNKECLNKLQPFLAQQFINSIKKIQHGQHNVQGFGSVYQLYSYLMGNGIEGVNVEMLEGVVGREGVYDDEGFFQLVLLVDQPILLQLWFNQTNRRIQKPPNYPHSFSCLLSLIISYLSKPHPASYIDHLCQVCKQSILCLLREQKDTRIQIEIICGYILKFLVKIISKLELFSICVDICSNLELVSTKHNLPQIQKTISIIHLYCNLIHHHKNIDVHNKFVKLHATVLNSSPDKDKDCDKEKYRALRLLRACSQMQLGIRDVDEEVMSDVRGRVEFGLLFCQPSQRCLLVLGLSMQEIASMGDPFQLYFAILSQNILDDHITSKTATHIQKFLLSTQFCNIRTSRQSIMNIKSLLIKLITKQNEIYSILVLYMHCFSLQLQKIKQQKYGIVLNKYSKLLKIVDIVGMYQEQICRIVKIVICKCNGKFKKQFIQHGKCNPEPGQLTFLSILFQKLTQHSPMDTTLIFTKFNIFQTFCINNRNEQLEQIIDEQKNTELQQLYINSQFIPRRYKLILLRKLFRSYFVHTHVNTGGSGEGKNVLLSLSQVKQLIMLAETEEQCGIYVGYAVNVFGDVGRKFVALLAEQHEKVGRVCLNILAKADT